MFVVLLTNFNPSENAVSYNSKFKNTIQQIIDEIQKRKDWIGVDWVKEGPDDESKKPQKSVKLLDYACGTGLVSRVCPLVPPIFTH